MREAVYCDTEKEFRDWFEKNLKRFGIRKIIVNQEVCPDYVVIMEDGETKRIEAELLAINFKYHYHEPAKVDLILACYANQTEVMGIPVVAVNRLWECRSEPVEDDAPVDEPLAEDELRLLNIIQFHGGIEITALCQREFSGSCRLYLPLTPDSIAKWPRGKIEGSIFNVVSPSAKQFIKKYHHAVIGVGMSEAACAAIESLSKRDLIKTQPISWIAAVHDGVIVDHPGWIPTELCATDNADQFRKLPQF